MFEQTQNQGQPSQVSPQAIPEPTVKPASVAPLRPSSANFGVAGPTITEPKDMFADVDAAGPASVATLPSAIPDQTPQGFEAGYTFEEEEPKPWYMQKKFIILLSGIVLLLIIMIFGVQFAFRFFVKPIAPIVPAEQPVKAAPLAPEPTTQQPVAPSQEQQQPVAPAQVDANQQQNGQQLDTDGDGLLDAEEQAIGSSITLSDTDGDALSDREEFRVFGTDPKNPDSDGDTYTDGVEVKNGYNPKGQGKLFNIPTE